MFDKVKDVINSVIGERHEVTDSIREALEERLTSPFYGYFIVSWVLINWDYIYTALFVGGEEILEKTGLLKNEYLLQKILPSHLSSLDYWMNFLVYPFLLTCFVIWVMPKITRIFLRQHIRNKVQNEQIRNEELQAEIESETKVLEAEVAQAKVKEEAKSISPDILWRNEYEEFKKHKLFSKFQDIIDSVYNHSGFKSIYDSFAERTTFEIGKNILVYADVNGLITIDNTSDKIKLTEKGKEFVRWYSNEN